MKLFLAIAIALQTGCCRENELPKAFKDLYSKDHRERNEAALVLAQCGAPKANTAVPRLIALLKDENVGVQSSAAYALRRIATKEASAALVRSK